MSAAVIWIFIPIAVGLLLFAVNRFAKANLVVAASVLAVLAWLAWKLPTGVTMRLGPLAVRISDTLDVLGRKFVITQGDRPVVIFICVMAACWFAGSALFNTNRLFAPVGMFMVGLFIAALAVQPFLYAALLIEIAVLVSIPMLAPPGSKLGAGAMRYLIFQTMALPFILFTGWMLTGLEAGSTDVSLPLRAGVLLGLGFGFLLAVFPFYSWIPLIAEENQPFISGFIFLLLPCVVLFFGVSFLDQYAWIADASILYVMLRLIGTLMIVTGGLLAAFQNHLGRIFGYAVIVETGYLLLSVGLGIKQGLPLFCTLLAPRAFGFGLWAFALSVLAERCGGLEFKQISGAARRYPITVIGLFIAQLSLMGLPLLADFPVKLVIWQGTGNVSTLNLVWVLLAVVGMATAALRSLPVLLQGVGWQVQSSGNRIKQFIVLVGALILISVGLFPQFFFPAMLNLMQTFPHLL